MYISKVMCLNFSFWSLSGLVQRRKKIKFKFCSYIPLTKQQLSREVVVQYGAIYKGIPVSELFKDSKLFFSLFFFRSIENCSYTQQRRYIVHSCCDWSCYLSPVETDTAVYVQWVSTAEFSWEVGTRWYLRSLQPKAFCDSVILGAGALGSAGL